MTEYSLNKQFKNPVQKTQQQQQSNKQEMEQHNEDKSAKSPDFFQENNTIKKKKKVLSKDLYNYGDQDNLSSISNTGINKEAFYNKSFVFDVYVLLTKSLSLFSLDSILSDQNKHKMIYMLWKECIS